MEKITTAHLSRTAYVYIRQSSQAQLLHNMESRRVQARLMEKAQTLGWPAPRLVEDDLGRTANGTVDRAGFEGLLAAVCAGEVGAIFSFEVSRLARNGREWHTLLEMCAIVDTMIVDTEAVYDPKIPNDRLLLGLKGTISELELGMFRQRTHTAIQEKAKRGEFYGIVAVGYRKAREGRLEKEPDVRVQRALEFVFEKFPQFGSARQLTRWLREEKIEIPRKEVNNDDSPICWRLPTQAALISMLKNPVYAGAYVYGRSKRRTIIKNGRKRVVTRNCSDPAQWGIIIRDHHPGYINWVNYERNVEMLKQNVNMKGSMTPGGIRGGASVFAGILRCGRCGRKVLVCYCGLRSRSMRYSCSSNSRDEDGKRCLSFSATALERTLVGQLLETVSPLGVQAALQAVDTLAVQGLALREQRELELTQARYESELARRQYNAVDPANRLVASELERRWNEALHKVAGLEEALYTDVVPDPVAINERQELLALGQNLADVWDNPASSAETKKRIARLLVKEIVLFEETGSIKAVVHWQGGVHTELKTPRLTSKESGSPTNANTREIIRKLARQMPDRFIARVLNRLKIATARGLTWNEARVCAIRHGYDIAVYQEGEREARCEMNMLEAAKELGIERRTLGELIKKGYLLATQACAYAPWVIRREDIQSAQLQGMLRQPPAQVPCAENENQLTLKIQ
jgi:DNA invertase Pin-like site-specific DNA recombinase